MRNGSCMTSVSYRLNYFIMMKNLNLFQNRNCSNRGLWWLSGDLTLPLSITAFWNLARISLAMFSSPNWMKWTCDRHFLINEVQVCFMTILGHMMPGWHCRSSPAWDTIFHWPLAHWLTHFQVSWQCLSEKAYPCIKDDATTFKDYLAFKHFTFYRKAKK